MAAFGSPAEVFGASEEGLRRVDGARPSSVRAILEFNGWDDARRELDAALGMGVEVVTMGDAAYPPHLSEIHDPPPVMYVKGALLPEDKVALAVVGSRQATATGRQLTRRIARELSERGLTIVSGGARGRDTEAHRGALAGRGRTICILGCGIDVDYPPENRDLMGLIAEQGAVVTEFPLGTPPEPNNFPRRNRIISGMSMGVLVMEAAGDSGSLITASYALEQGREVFAVPGSVSLPTSRGTNSLIKRGARLVEGSYDILSDLFPNMKEYLREFGGPDEPQSEAPGFNLEADEKAIFDCISLEPTHIGALVAKSGIAASRALSLLLSLELKGAVRQVSGMRFMRGCA